MPPLVQTDERRSNYNRELSVFPSPVSVRDIHVLSNTKIEQLCRRKSLNTELALRRKVKFATIKTALLEDIPPASSMCEDEKRILWWTKDEMNESLESIGKLMRSMSSRPRNYNSTEPYHTLLYRIEDVCKKSDVNDKEEEAIPADDIKLLAKWHHVSLSKRGLEKLVLDCSEHTQKVRSTIVHASSSARSNPNIDDAMKAECIRVCSERLSKPSRMFAKALGDADALSLNESQRERKAKRGSELLRGKRIQK